MRSRRRTAQVLVVASIGLAISMLLRPLANPFLYPARGRSDTAIAEDFARIERRGADGVIARAIELAPASGAAAERTVVYFHGNGEVVGDNVGLAHEIARRGLACVLAEYRGYGISSPGTPTEDGLYADAEAILDELAARGVSREKIVLWGMSLGTGVAVEMARRGRGSALVLVAPYTSIPDVATHHVPFLPAGLLLRDRYDNRAKARAVDVPTLIVHGTRDEVVPFEMGKTLAGLVRGARFVPVEGGHHNDLFAGLGWRNLEVILSFIRETAGSRS